ncbi:unnamed protein product [Ceutorhynchus assimilis]|uniref:Uncharacterized protein n=1 Tax=Ceutorhynchus assimilis TaxID=467358 RepID=A0A9N9QLQ0_9CUCU|nr:unnamed protein product [Ceutorhynchus assimilis]
MDTDNNSCILCQCALIEDIQVVKKVGINTVRMASLRRKDGIYNLLRNCEYMKLHRKKCYLPYILERNILRDVEKNKNNDGRTRSLHNTFDFKSNCFICGLTVEINKKLPLKYRKKVQLVETIEFREKILSFCTNQESKDYTDIVARMSCIADLVAAEGRYHRSCYQKLCNGALAQQRDENKCEKKDAFGLLFSYMESCEECQFTMTEISDKLGELDPDSDYTEKWIQTKLKEHFRSNIIITPRKKLPAIISLRIDLNSLLNKAFYESTSDDPQKEKQRILSMAASILREEVKEKIYDCSFYPDFENLHQIASEQTPKGLLFFFSELLLKEELISISSGVSVKDEKKLINCDNVQLIAKMSLQQVIGKPFSEFHVKKTFKVKTLGDVKVVGNKVNPVDVNPQQFFNRVLLTMRNENDLKTFFEHELSTYPPYFFSQGKLRKGNKSVLVSHLCKDNFDYEKPETLNNPLSVIDGGCLLHKIIWPKLVTFGDIFKIYCKHVIENFGFNSWVIFDGYSEMSTKDEEHRRRQSKITPRVEFQENTLLIFSQADFLSNTSNKERFISHLADKLKEKGIKVTHTKSDCDSIVASTAISECKAQDVVVFVNITITSVCNRNVTFLSKEIYQPAICLGTQHE